MRMSLDGIWSVHFASNMGGGGTGIAVFEGQRICGGDQDFIYSGTHIVTPDGKDMIADIRVSNYSGSASIFGPAQEFNLHIEGPALTTSTIGAIIQATWRVSTEPALQFTSC
jgi:hypothetical protein